MKNSILILGSGRSGTSVLTNILTTLGMSGSDELIGATDANPKGAFEDKEIFQLQREIFDDLKLSGYFPLPDNFMDFESVKRKIPVLKDVVSKRLSQSDQSWGFKDPKTASLLPVWLQIFNSLRVVPIYIVAIRDPTTVAMSLNRNYNDKAEAGELAWLVRTCDALYYSGANCFIVHYEDWFTKKANKIVRELAAYTGLNKTLESSEASVILSDTIEESLNRSVFTSYEVKNPLVKKLYEELQTCRGFDFNRERLMTVVNECRQMINCFYPWISLSIDNKGSKDLVLSVSRLQSEVKKLKDDNENLRIKVKNITGISGNKGTKKGRALSLIYRVRRLLVRIIKGKLL